MNGIFLFNKPKGITSHDVVYLLRRKTNIKKIGHTGTLDPLATGVLPMCIGKATKVSDFILKGNKEYIAEGKLGIETDTYDITGTVVENCERIPTCKELESKLECFTGVQKQIPPMYSAIKIQGKKLYEYARQGIEVKREPREVLIYEIQLLNFDRDSFRIKVSCSAGTYIRSLIYDIGKSLNTCATLTELTRTKTSVFKLEDCISQAELEQMDLVEMEKRLIPMDQALLHLPFFNVPKGSYHLIMNGGFLPLKEKLEKGYYRLYCNDEFLGIGEIRNIKDKDFMKMNKKLIR